MTEIALLTWQPKWCPNCGVHLPIHPDDWQAGSTHSCPDSRCGILFARVDERQAIEASRATGGDLATVVTGH